MECLNGFLSLSSTHQTIGSVDDDEKSSSSATELQRVVDQMEGNGSRRLQNDSTTLPNVQHQHLLVLVEIGDETIKIRFKSKTCNCGVIAILWMIESETPNKGRPY
ncbi:unnamed protein product [Camellia sinensis]